jgi:hypothetical protein
MFFGLPYLSVNLVSDAFREISSKTLNHQKCIAFANYVLESYINTVQAEVLSCTLFCACVNEKI